jgi:hypothetical protein
VVVVFNDAELAVADSMWTVNLAGSEPPPSGFG